MARPRIQIDWDEFDKLCGLQCTQVEIASWFNCSVDTVDRAVIRAHRVGFAEYFEQKAAKGKISLRRKQWTLAMQGDRTMLVWLGKQYLAQKDKNEIENIGNPTGAQVVLYLPENGSEAPKDK